MKKPAVIVFLFFLSISLKAQHLPAYYLTKIPSVPKDACVQDPDSVTRNMFRKDIRKLSKELATEISTREKEIKTDVKNSEAQIKQEKAKEIGLTDAQVKKLNQKNLTSAEKKAIINEVLKNQQFSSLTKTKNAEGRKAWTESYSTQQQAKMMDRMSSPDSVKSVEELKMEKKQEKNNDVRKLAEERQLIIDRIAASDKKFTNKLNELNKMDSVESMLYFIDVSPFLKRLSENPPPDHDKKLEINRQIQQLGKRYCNKLSPVYRQILVEAEISLKSLSIDYTRLDELTAEYNEKTLGPNRDFTSPGLSQIKAIKRYVNWLSQVYKYEKDDSSIDPEDNEK
jgi:hypothetical protein